MSQWPLTGNTATLSVGNWYAGKVVVDGRSEQRRAAAAALLGRYRRRRQLRRRDHADQRQRAYIDADWSAGYVGLYNWWYDAVAQEFDDVQVGFDNNSDGDILDAGDAIQANDDFSSNVVNLVYDDNGNLTRDGRVWVCL